MFNYLRLSTYQTAEWNKANNGKTFLSPTESFKFLHNLSMEQHFRHFLLLRCPTKHIMEQQYCQFLKHKITCCTWHRKQIESGPGARLTRNLDKQIQKKLSLWLSLEFAKKWAPSPPVPTPIIC